MEEKRQRISDLIRAGVSLKAIPAIKDCSLALIYKVRSLEKAGKGLSRKSGSGGHNKLRDDDFLTGIAAEIAASPTTSMRRLAKDLNCSKTTVNNAVRDLGAFSYVRRRRQILTPASKASRLTRVKGLLNWLKHHPATVKIFSDKKLWTVDQSRNSRNDRYLAYCVEEVPPIHCSKHPASAMMLGVVASDGKAMPPYWFPKGLKISAKEYQEVLETVVKPWITENYEGQAYVWQQDSAPGHKVITTQKWCQDNFHDFWRSTQWPPNAPDANPLDYGVWGAVESKACNSPHSSVDSLKASVEQEWAAMSTAFIKSTCSAFRPRLEAMIAAKGGHFEK